MMHKHKKKNQRSIFRYIKGPPWGRSWLEISRVSEVKRGKEHGGVSMSDARREAVLSRGRGHLVFTKRVLRLFRKQSYSQSYVRTVVTPHRPPPPQKKNRSTLIR